MQNNNTEPSEGVENNTMQLPNTTNTDNTPPPLKKIILNFKSNDHYDEASFSANGWKVFNVDNLSEAYSVLHEYLGDNKADIIHINGHGGVGMQFAMDENGWGIPIEGVDPSAPLEQRFEQTEESGAHLGHSDKDWIFSHSLRRYNDPNMRALISQEERENIEALVRIGNMVGEGKNLVFGTCSTAYNDDFGEELKKLISPSIDIFINKGICIVYSSNGKITHHLFITKPQSSNPINGWIRYNKDNETRTYNNLIYTRTGIRLIP